MSWKIKSNYSCNWLVEYVSIGLSKNVKYTVQIIKTSRGAIDLSKAVLREGGEGGQQSWVVEKFNLMTANVPVIDNEPEFYEKCDSSTVVFQIFCQCKSTTWFLHKWKINHK